MVNTEEECVTMCLVLTRVRKVRRKPLVASDCFLLAVVSVSADSTLSWFNSPSCASPGWRPNCQHSISALLFPLPRPLCVYNTFSRSCPAAALHPQYGGGPSLQSPMSQLLCFSYLEIMGKMISYFATYLLWQIIHKLGPNCELFYQEIW